MNKEKIMIAKLNQLASEYEMGLLTDDEYCQKVILVTNEYLSK